MKSMTCKQLGGACEEIFQADTFDQIVELSKIHGMEMFQAQDPDHIQAIAKVQMMMQNPAEMTKWFEDKKQEFDNLAED